jgi:amino acid permease
MLDSPNLGFFIMIKSFLVLAIVHYRAIVVAAFCLGTCFDMLFAWMPTYFHDNYPDSQVVFQYFKYNTL